MATQTDSLDELLDIVFGRDARRMLDTDFIVGRAVLTPRNADVDLINAKVMSRFLGEVELSPFPTAAYLQCETFAQIACAVP